MCGKPAAAIQIDAGGADDGPMSVTLVQFGGGIVAKLPVSEAAPREEPIDVTPEPADVLGDLA